MSVTVKPVAARGERAFMGAITGGERLHDALARVARALDISAAVVHPLGGLTEVEFRRRDFLTGEDRPPLRVPAACEIVGGHATISWQDGQPSVHAHLIVTYPDASAPNGAAVAAGHVIEAACFAVEFTLLAFDGDGISRAFSAEAGFAVWSAPPLSGALHGQD